jgi:hypothetical protein
MNLAATIAVYGGGPGSGCTGPNCGRPAGEHQLTQHLKEMSEHFPKQGWSGIYRKGHAGVIAPFTDEEKKELKLLKVGMNCKVGYCYMNAQKIATRALHDQRVKYMEGLVTVHGVPINHAWIEYNGKVFDPTLYDRNFKLKQDREEGEYYGMEVPKELIWKNQLKSKTYSPLTGWQSDFAEELLK